MYRLFWESKLRLGPKRKGHYFSWMWLVILEFSSSRGYLVWMLYKNLHWPIFSSCMCISQCTQKEGLCIDFSACHILLSHRLPLLCSRFGSSRQDECGLAVWFKLPHRAKIPQPCLSALNMERIARCFGFCSILFQSSQNRCIFGVCRYFQCFSFWNAFFCFFLFGHSSIKLAS